jgi:hypothetical protein
MRLSCIHACSAAAGLDPKRRGVAATSRDQPRPVACNNLSVDLASELQRIYDSEINVQIGWLWDGGMEVRLGDDVNGFVAEETFALVAGILPWLQQAIAHFYPESSYARTLDPEVKQLALQRLFRPSRIGMRVDCPHCGAPNVSRSGIEELFAFICSHCGESVSVEPRPVQ